MDVCMLLNGASDRYALKQKGTIFELLNVIFFTCPVTYYNLPTLQDKSYDGSSSFGSPRFITHSFTSCFILHNGLCRVCFLYFINLLARQVCIRTLWVTILHGLKMNSCTFRRSYAITVYP